MNREAKTADQAHVDVKVSATAMRDFWGLCGIFDLTASTPTLHRLSHWTFLRSTRDISAVRANAISAAALGAKAVQNGSFS